jgi:hypothetical protein
VALTDRRGAIETALAVLAAVAVAVALVSLLALAESELADIAARNSAAEQGVDGQR